MTTKNWTVIPGDRALRSALARADSIDNQPPTVTDYQKNKLDIALGERIVMNDPKPGGLQTAIAWNVERDKALNEKYNR